MKKAIHIKAIDWALALDYFISVRDVSEDAFDIKWSQDRAAIIDAIEGTELPNVFITDKSDPESTQTDTGQTRNKYRRVAVFSVIDEGEPDETINDYIDRPGGEFDQWMDRELSV